MLFLRMYVFCFCIIEFIYAFALLSDNTEEQSHKESSDVEHIPQELE